MRIFKEKFCSKIFLVAVLMASVPEAYAAKSLKKAEAIRVIRRELNTSRNVVLGHCAEFGRAPLTLSKAGYVLPKELQYLVRAELRLPEILVPEAGACVFDVVFQSSKKSVLKGARYSIDEQGVISGMAQFGSVEELIASIRFQLKSIFIGQQTYILDHNRYGATLADIGVLEMVPLAAYGKLTLDVCPLGENFVAVFRGAVGAINGKVWSISKDGEVRGELISIPCSNKESPIGILLNE